MTVLLRFAPSPTGYLHIGNLRPALINWLVAKKLDGTFLLRFDDTDPERSKDEYAQAIREDLDWLGLTADREVKQSDRLEIYRGVEQDLKARGLLYPCYETAEELSLKRKVALSSGRPPVYDRAALKLGDDDRAKFEADGVRPHWRFKLPAETVEWDDLIQGPKSVDLTSQSDPVLIREDGSPLYTLPSVIDDLEFGVSHIIRGEDHVTNTAVQIAIIRALGGTPPIFAHHALLTGAKGEGLSKRLGSLAIRSFREAGLEPLAVTSFLAKIGTSDPIEPAASLDALVESFEFSKLSRAPARFDEAELEGLNAKLLHATPFARVADRLADLGIEGPQAEPFWDLIRANIEKLSEAKDWWPVVAGGVEPVIEDEELTRAAADLVPDEADDETWAALTGALKEQTGKKGKALFMPLRLALTGKNHGPELGPLLKLMGSKRARARLLGHTA